MPMVTISMYPGRTVDQKRQIVQGITKAFEDVGVNKNAVMIVINESPKENWGQGGQLASDNK